MKAKALLLFISVACVPTVCLFGQVDCTTSTKLACEFPVSTQILLQHTVGYSPTNSAAYQGALTAASTINASVATQLTQLPIPSATVGVVTLAEKGNPLGKAFDNLGPILTDRPDTVGKGHLFLGFSYQRFKFNAIDGVPISKLPANFTFTQPSAFNANDIQTFYGSESNNVDFSFNQYVWVLTYGATKSTDISIIVPYNTVSLSVAASTFHAAVYDPATGTYTNLSPAGSTAVTTTGTSHGVGDVSLNFKQMLIGGEGSRAAAAAGVVLRFPTGDALNYIGSGALGANVYGLFEYRARVAPHMKMAYQYNDVSQIMDLSVAPTTRLPGGLQYDFGADVRVKPYLTLAGDLLGGQFINTPSFTLNPTDLSPAPPASSGISSQYIAVRGINNTYTTANLSGGVKVSLGKYFLFYGNVLKQLNNVGFRSDLVPLFGVAFRR